MNAHNQKLLNNLKAALYAMDMQMEYPEDEDEESDLCDTITAVQDSVAALESDLNLFGEN